MSRKHLPHLSTVGLILLVLAGLPLGIAAQGEQASENLAYLLDGVTELYVVDESKCSAQPNSPDSGRWYVIEAKEALGRLKPELGRVGTDEEGACGCGGPDIHFYGVLLTGGLRYFGLDCERFLDGYSIGDSLVNLLVPSRRGFLGKPGGATYIVDVPLDVPEEEVRAKFAKQGMTCLVGGWWNAFSGLYPREYASQLHLRDTAPVHLELEVGPVRAPKSAKNDFREGARFMEKEASERIRKWLDRQGLAPLLLLPVDLGGGSGTLEEQTFNPDCFLRNADTVRRIMTKAKKDHSFGVSISALEYRPQAEVGKNGLYQTALLLPDEGLAEGLRRAKALLPTGCSITPLCERQPQPD